MNVLSNNSNKKKKNNNTNINVNNYDDNKYNNSNRK